mgnify:CR=1 FL=1
MAGIRESRGALAAAASSMLTAAIIGTVPGGAFAAPGARMIDIEAILGNFHAGQAAVDLPRIEKVLAVPAVVSETTLDVREKELLVSRANGASLGGQETLFSHVTIALRLGSRDIPVRQYSRRGVQSGIQIDIAYHPLPDGRFVLLKRAGSIDHFYLADLNQTLTDVAVFDNNQQIPVTEAEARSGFAVLMRYWKRTAAAALATPST